METQTSRTTHPLMIIAAASVTLFSLAGIAAIMGWIPASSTQTQAPVQFAAVTQASAPAVQTRIIESIPEPKPVEPRVAGPRPVAKPRVKPAVAKAEPVEPRQAPVQVAANDYPPVAQAEPRHDPVAPRYEPPPPPPVPQVEAPRKLCYECGVVESVREIAKPGEGSGLGAIAGSLLGSLLGHQMGNGRGQTVMTVVGAAGGALAGHQVEKSMKKAHNYELIVRFEDGTTRTLAQESAPIWRAGDRVKVVNGTVQPNA